MANNNRILSNVEKDFMRSAFKLGLRIDGRQLKTVREMKISFGAKTGSVEVSLGKTRVLARVCHELGSPHPSKPNQGVISINCTFPKYYHESISKEDTDRICLIIKAGIMESKAIDLESLCILNGEKVWKLSCDISVIQHDGNIIDCANLATLCALKHHRRPDVTVVGSKIAVHSMYDRHPVALSIHHLPICVTLAHVLYPGANDDDKFWTFNDPNISEEKLMDGKTVYCMTRHNALCAVDKIGGVAMNAKDFLSFIDANVMDIVKKWSNQIENKFIQYQYKANDALSRKKALNKTMEDAIDIFGYSLLNEKKMEMKMDVDKGEKEKDDDNMWMEWENEEKIKMETIRNNLELKSTEKRISTNKSVLTSEFD